MTRINSVQIVSMSNREILIFALIASLGVLTASSVAGAQTTAAVSMEDVEISAEGETAQSTITMDAESGISVADATVSVDTSVAEITGVSPGSDIDTDAATTQFEVTNRSDSTVTVRYTNIAEVGSADAFELAVIEFEGNSVGETEIGLEVPNLADDSANDYEINEASATLSVGSGSTQDSQDDVEDSENASSTGQSEQSNQDQEDQNETDTGQGMPGFTFTAALLSLLAIALFCRD